MKLCFISLTKKKIFTNKYLHLIFFLRQADLKYPKSIINTCLHNQSLSPIPSFKLHFKISIDFGDRIGNVTHFSVLSAQYFFLTHECELNYYSQNQKALQLK